MTRSFNVLTTAALSALLCLSTGAQADTKVRTTSFEYEAATGLLAKTTSEPLTPNDCLQVSVLRDSFGKRAHPSSALNAKTSGPTRCRAQPHQPLNDTQENSQ